MAENGALALVRHLNMTRPSPKRIHRWSACPDMLFSLAAASVAASVVFSVTVSLTAASSARCSSMRWLLAGSIYCVLAEETVHVHLVALHEREVDLGEEEVLPTWIKEARHKDKSPFLQ